MAAAPVGHHGLQPKSGVVDPDHPLYDPDLIKMPESGPHSRTVDLIVLATSHLLPDVWVFGDLNWYPPDGGNAVAPDVIVLPKPACDRPPKSYNQRVTGGPDPLVVVEVVSESDTFASMRAKTHRYQRLGVAAYVIVLDGVVGLLRFGPDDDELVPWNGRPIPELGGFSIDFVDDVFVLTQPDGTTARTAADLLAAAHDQVGQAAGERDRAVAERDALRARLRELGVDPDQVAAP